jgi:hypothetical protein
MKKLLLLGAFLTLAGCYDTFRYPCQNPKNHNTANCQPPACEADGTCTKYLLKETNEN